MNVPNHIAIILDGNGRWAKAKGMPRSYGHVKGCANLETVCDYMKELGVKYVTVYAFSTENWKRSKDEVDGLMKLFRSYLKKCIKLADKNKMRVRVIGEVSAFDQDIQESIARLEQYSQKYDEIYFQIALNYGSRDEIIRGIRKLAQDAADGKVKPEEIDEHVFDNYLDTAGIPDPDLMIRTSGELRLSNFLLWQMAYTEFYFTDVAWPDFNKAELIKAIEKYNQRDRRYGGASVFPQNCKNLRFSQCEIYMIIRLDRTKTLGNISKFKCIVFSHYRFLLLSNDIQSTVKVLSL